MKNTHCSPIQRMVVKSAQYGNFNNGVTFNQHATIEARCSQVINCRIKSFCDGKRSCERTVDNNLLPSTLCSTASQIYIKYTCVDISSYSPAITNEGNAKCVVSAWYSRALHVSTALYNFIYMLALKQNIVSEISLH